MRRYQSFIAAVVALSSVAGNSQSGERNQYSVQSEAPERACHAYWGDEGSFGTGVTPAIALNGLSGIFVEVNSQRRGNTSDLVYRIGRSYVFFYPPDVGSPQTFAVGSNPGISMNSDGVLIEVHQALPPLGGFGTDVFYRIGKIDLSAGVNQQVEWSSPAYSYDGGQLPQVAINDKNQVVEVHETNSLLNNKLYYRTGIIDRIGERHYIRWLSGISGVEYDIGRHPHISIDNDGNVIEVHQASSSNNLHYRRGRITELGVNWAPPASNGRYVTGGAQNPVVAQASNGIVLEAHERQGQSLIEGDLGQLNSNNRSVVDWSNWRWQWLNGSDVGLSASGSKIMAVYTGPGYSIQYSTGQTACN